MSDNTSHKPLLDTLTQVSSYLADGLDTIQLLDIPLRELLGLSNSKYGFIAEIQQSNNAPAKKVSELTKDISEILSRETLPLDRIKPDIKNIAFHSPCTLQHGQKLDGVVESILKNCGFELTDVEDSHLCCGSAGTYSILQADLSQQLLNNKLNALQKQSPELIATTNIGCQLHMQTKADIPVKHWIEILDESFI